MKSRDHLFRKRVMAAALFVLISISLSGCKAVNVDDAEQDSRVEEDIVQLQDLDVTVVEGEDGAAVFDVSIEDFIAGFNSARGEAYLPPPHEWPFYNTMAIHADNEALRYHYSEDESIRAIPEISVFTPITEDTIQQIIISYDDHSYSIPTYEMYEELCFYALKTMMPDMADSRIREICTEINTLADENITDVHYSSDAVPCRLYHKNGTGIYPYYCIGEELRFCIIPVTEDLLKDFEERGTDIIALQN